MGFLFQESTWNPIEFHCMDNEINIFQNIFFCISQKKASHTDLKWEVIYDRIFIFWLNYQSRVCFFNNIVLQYKILPKKPSHQALCCQPTYIQQKRGCEQNGVTAKSTSIKPVFFFSGFFAFPAPCSHKTKWSHFHSIPLTHTHTRTIWVIPTVKM